MTSLAAVAARLERAETDLASAEAALETALGELIVLPREQKVGVSSGVEEAFAALRIARSRIASLRAELAR